MLAEFFYWILSMSIAAAVTGIAVLLIRSVKRIPRRVTVFLWLIPFLRMAVPFGLNSPYSLMSLLSKITDKSIVIYQPMDTLRFSMMNCVTAADSYFPLIYKSPLLAGVFHWASLIWGIIALGILLLLALVYLTALREVRDAVHLYDNIYRSDTLQSPAVYGIIKPRILLPASFADKDTELIILHERMHIRRLDNLWRMLALVLTAIHWFNPFCWLFLKEFFTDLELACDECVIACLGEYRKKDYAFTLLESRHRTSIFASPFGGAKIRTRIENILSFRKLTWLSLTALITLSAIIFYVLLTNPA